MKTNAIFSKKQLFGVCCALLLSPMAVFGQLIVGKVWEPIIRPMNKRLWP